MTYFSHKYDTTCYRKWFWLCWWKILLPLSRVIKKDFGLIYMQHVLLQWSLLWVSQSTQTFSISNLLLKLLSQHDELLSSMKGSLSVIWFLHTNLVADSIWLELGQVKNKSSINMQRCWDRFVAFFCTDIWYFSLKH